MLEDLFKKNDPKNEFKLLYGPLEYNYTNVYIDVLRKYEEVILDFNKSGLDFNLYMNQVDKLKFIHETSKSIFMRIQDLKDSSFFEEKEFRIFWQEEKSASIKSINKFQKGNVFIPYVELIFEEVIPIKEIIIGPTVPDKEFCRQNIVDALKFHGYDTDKIIIEDSKIPYRK